MKPLATEQITRLQNKIDNTEFNITQDECELNNQLDKLNNQCNNNTDFQKQEITVAKLQSKINNERNELKQEQQELTSIQNK